MNSLSIYFKYLRFIAFQDVASDFDIKEKIEEVIKGLGEKELRARTMDIDDFMKVLHAFNKEGIHFS